MSNLDRYCDECGEEEGEEPLKPVIRKSKTLPQLLCSACYETLDTFNKIERDHPPSSVS